MYQKNSAEYEVFSQYQGLQNANDGIKGADRYVGRTRGRVSSRRWQPTPSQLAEVQQLKDDGKEVVRCTFRHDGVMNVSFRLGKLDGIARIGRRGGCVGELSDLRALNRADVVASLVEALPHGGRGE